MEIVEKGNQVTGSRRDSPAAPHQLVKRVTDRIMSYMESRSQMENNILKTNGMCL